MTSPDWIEWFRDVRPRTGFATQELTIAGRSLRLDVAGDSIRAALNPAFAPMIAETAASQSSGHLSVWADEQYLPPTWRDGRGPAIRFPNGGLLVSHALLPAAEAFVPDQTIMLWGHPDAFASGDIRSQPASTAIAAWLAQTGALVLHVGAVSDSNGAALLLGRSGAGKSTTALACAMRGMGILGDDFCVVTTDGVPTVHALYATAKVAHDSEQRLGLTAHPAVARTSKNKKVLALSDQNFIRSAPIVALIVLARSSTAAAPTPLSRNDVMRALAPTALKAAIGAGSLDQWLRGAAFLAREIPGFLVNADWDLEALVRSVADTIAMGKAVLSR